MNATAIGTTPKVPLAQRFRQTRGMTETLCAPLAVEDFVVQSMTDVSPTRWHLAHTAWFFDTFVLARWERDYQPVRPEYRYLFNSYYDAVGKQFPRSRRGLLTRPTVAEVFLYRHAVGERVLGLLERAEEEKELARVVELGIHHEQQHQELILSDIKHVFSCNPLFPVYRDAQPPSDDARPGIKRQLPFGGDVVEIGHSGPEFAFDNERPRHKVYLQPYRLHDRLVTNGQYREFIEDGGYRRAELWLSLGWATVGEQQWTAPLYWFERDGAWFEFTLSGLRPLRAEEPVCHLSYFEADAFARWAGARLPTEAEWEHTATHGPESGSFLESGRYHPAAKSADDDGVKQMYGELWQWTASPYTGYPGYRAPPGAMGEYNGKFMCNQYVLRGGSCVTPAEHVRPTYRNFYPPQSRWLFSGLRLAGD